MKIANYFLLLVFGALMIYGTLSLPNRGDADAVMNQEKSAVGSPGSAAYYIQHAHKDAHTDNMVTVILADYRGFDTLGEETVIFTAGLICFLLLRKTTPGKEEDEEPANENDEIDDDEEIEDMK